MTRCPSEDWDRYDEAMEATAAEADAWQMMRAELHELRSALKLIVDTARKLPSSEGGLPDVCVQYRLGWEDAAAIASAELNVWSGENND